MDYAGQGYAGGQWSIPTLITLADQRHLCHQYHTRYLHHPYPAQRMGTVQKWMKMRMVMALWRAITFSWGWWDKNSRKQWCLESQKWKWLVFKGWPRVCFLGWASKVIGTRFLNDSAAPCCPRRKPDQCEIAEKSSLLSGLLNSFLCLPPPFFTKWLPYLPPCRVSTSLGCSVHPCSVMTTWLTAPRMSHVTQQEKIVSSFLLNFSSYQ